MTQGAISVMCVDDNQLLAEALERQIAADARFRWGGWVERTDELLERVSQTRPNVILLDVDMPGQDTFALVAELAQTSPDTRVLMFSAYVRRDYIDRAVEMGAWGYVSKNEDMADVLDAIQRAAAGEFVLTADAMSEQGVIR
jgi:DNA-binding NarL/FixJ family response regulator